jgi:hypothetical protein
MKTARMVVRGPQSGKGSIYLSLRFLPLIFIGLRILWGVSTTKNGTGDRFTDSSLIMDDRELALLFFLCFTENC